MHSSSKKSEGAPAQTQKGLPACFFVFILIFSKFQIFQTDQSDKVIKIKIL